MGFFGIFKDKKNRDLESSREGGSDKNPSGFDLVGGLTGTGRYAKTDEEKDEAKENKTLKIRLGDLKIKKYKNNRLPRYNDAHTKQRFEVGVDFDFRTLPNLIYSTAKRNGTFRSKIGGRFSTSDRDELKRIMQKNSYTVKKMKRQLDHRDEGHCKVNLSELFN